MNYTSEYDWHKLDNAAKIFPAITSLSATNVYRIGVRLNDRVGEVLLQKALILALKKFPSFCVKMKRGLFWYYLEHNFDKPVVRKEIKYPCSKIDKFANKGFLFRVSYFNTKINLDVYHSLTDGTGAIKFLRQIVIEYILLKNPQIIIDENEDGVDFVSKKAMSEDSFKKFNQEIGIGKSHNSPCAYYIDGVQIDKGALRVITGVINLKEFIAFVKSKNASITEYFAALLIYCIYNESYKYNPVDKPIVVNIPVNLRNYFDSNTARNFFSYVSVKFRFNNGQLSFDEILNQTIIQMKEQLKKELLVSKIKYNLKAESNLAVRFVPLFMKNIALKTLHHKGEKGFTMPFSNLGVVKLPKEMSGFVDRFDFMLGGSKAQLLKAGLCSYENKLVFTFSTTSEDTSIQRMFFKYLSDLGMDIVLSVNEEDNNEKM